MSYTTYPGGGSPRMQPAPYGQPHPSQQAAQIQPGSITYTTTTGPDGSLIYNPFKAVPASYQTPQGIVSGIQWVPAEATQVLPAGATPASADFAASFGRQPDWQREDEKRRKKERREREKAEERDYRRAQRDEEEELRRRERDARDRRDRGGSAYGAPYSYGNATADLERRFNDLDIDRRGDAAARPRQGSAYGASGYQTAPGANYPPTGPPGAYQSAPGYPPTGYQSAGPPPLQRPASPYQAGALQRPASPYQAGGAPRPVSPYHGTVAARPVSPYQAGAASLRSSSPYHAPRPVSPYAGPGGGHRPASPYHAPRPVSPYAGPGGGHRPASPYHAPRPVSPYAGPGGGHRPASPYHAPRPVSPYAGPGGGHRPASPYHAPRPVSPYAGPGVVHHPASPYHGGGATAQRPASPYYGGVAAPRPVSPYRRAGSPLPGATGVYPPGHVLEGQPIRPANLSRAPSPSVPSGGQPYASSAPYPGGAYGAQPSPYGGAGPYGSAAPGYPPPSGISGRASPRPPAGPGYPAEQAMLAAPEGFSRPPNLAQPYTQFETMKIQDMEDFVDDIPRMPKVLLMHDVYHEDWIRFTTDLGMAWTGKLPVPEYAQDGRPPKRTTLAADLIDLWNASFFLRRGVELVLYKGRERRSGRAIGTVDINLPDDDDDDDEDDDEDEDEDAENDYDEDRPRYGAYGGVYGRQAEGQMAELREARRARQMRKAERKQRKLEQKRRRKYDELKKRYALYLTCTPIRDGLGL